MATASSRLALTALGLLSLAACAPFGSEQTWGRFDNAPHTGEAVKYNMAVQTIDPDPVYPAGSAEPGSNGDIARSAAERYRKGEVKPIESFTTTKSVSGAGDSSGGSSGGK